MTFTSHFLLAISRGYVQIGWEDDVMSVGCFGLKSLRFPRGCDFSASVADFDKFRLKKAGWTKNNHGAKKCQAKVKSILTTRVLC